MGMTEKRFQYNVNKNTIEENGEFVAYMNCVDGGRIAKKLNILQKENEQLKKENQRMTDKLNELALEFLNYDMVTMGKATEISEMCYYDFLKYRKDNGNPMELQL